MGLATIDSHSLKEHTEIYKIPTFGVSRTNIKQDTAIWKCQNLQKKCVACRTCYTNLVPRSLVDEGEIWQTKKISFS